MVSPRPGLTARGGAGGATSSRSSRVTAARSCMRGPRWSCRNRSLPIDWIGSPLYPRHPPDDCGRDACVWYRYKHAAGIREGHWRRYGLERGGLERGGLERGGLERGGLERDGLER